MTQRENTQNMPDAHVRELLAQGIARVKDGEYDAGLSVFEDAAHEATDAGLTALAAGAAIDRGWALWLAGDREQSVEAYEKGAVLAREAGDDARLVIALGNLGIAYTDAGLHTEADALYAEYVQYLAEDPEEMVNAYLNWGVALEGLDRADEAFELYWKAFDIASGVERAELVGAVTMELGRAYTRGREYAKAADCFGEAARAFRYLEDHTLLGPALYQHGLALQRVGLLNEALEVWCEAEPVFHELGDHRGLGECLLEQALAVREQLSNYAPDLQFVEAAAAFRNAGMPERVPGIRLAHAVWCWDRSLDSAALTHVGEALDAVAVSSNPEVESRARALRAQLLADTGQIEAAEAELVQAEAVAEAAGDDEGVTGARVRRAFVMARAGASFEDVRAQLFAAGDYARERGHEAEGRYAADAVATEIEERCGRAYRDLLGPEDEKNVPVPLPGY